MTKNWMLMATMLSGMAVQLMHGEDADRKVTVNLDYDAQVPDAMVYRAERRVSKIFAGIGVTVEFHLVAAGKPESRRGVQLDMTILMKSPAGQSDSALALSHPYRADGRIEVFYSRIQEYQPVEGRDIVLAYILTHEITHALEGMQHHSPTGVMKEKWDRADVKEIQAGKLPFDPMDIEMIRNGIDKRVSDSHLAGNIVR